MRLKGRVALITGAARGQGRAEALLFAREGARVVIGDVLAEEGGRVETEINDSGGEALFVLLDVAKETDWDKAVAATVRRFGRLDILVNNAAILRTEALLETGDDIWDEVMAVNATGPFLGARAVIPVMREGGGGSIVNIVSGSALVGSPRATAYHASKGAARTFTKAAAIQYAGDNIRVNAIHPGNVETPMLHNSYKASWLEESRKSTLMGRFADPGEVAYAALFLASDEASYVTGAELVVDGGATAQ